MNKILLSILILLSTSFGLSYAQSYTNSSIIQIPANVSSVIAELKSKYNLDNQKVSALNQVARSYQYILAQRPTIKADAFSINRRDVAATNCASSRISGQILEESLFKIEEASLDTANKKNIYDNYILLLDDYSADSQIIDSCEDGFSGFESSIVSYSSGSRVLGGIVSDNDIKSKCLVLTKFLKFGSRDAQVYPLQVFLMENGYLELYPTGYFGRNTEFAVKEWQRIHNIDVRGYVGPSTRASIAGVTCDTEEAVNRAFLGPALNSSASIPTKKIGSTPNTTNNVVIKSTNNSQPASNQNTGVVVLPTTTSPQATLIVTQPQVNMSSSQGTFYRSGGSTNSLYFSYKANTSLDSVFICLEKTGNSNCQSSSSFVRVGQRFEPGNMDIIDNVTRYLFTIYYNQGNWGSTGGNIYIRNGINSISEVYNVKVSGL